MTFEGTRWPCSSRPRPSTAHLAARKQELLAQAGVVARWSSRSRTTPPPGRRSCSSSGCCALSDPAAVVVGEGFRFGHRARGTRPRWRRRASTCARSTSPAGRARPRGTGVVLVDPVRAGRWRRRVGRGHARPPHRVDGIVVRATSAGAPCWASRPEPAGGSGRGDAGGRCVRRLVHRLDALTEGQPAAISVGSNPTFDGVQRGWSRTCSTGDDLELYGVLVAVEFTLRIRGQVKFDSVEALVTRCGPTSTRSGPSVG